MAIMTSSSVKPSGARPTGRRRSQAGGTVILIEGEIDMFLMNADLRKKGVQHNGEGAVFLFQMDDGGLHIPSAEETDDRFPIRFSDLPGVADAGNPYPFGEADRPLADFGLLFGGRIGAVGPEARLF